MSATVRRDILSKAETSKPRAFAVGAVMATLYENGLEAVFWDLTTQDEALRVASDTQ